MKLIFTILFLSCFASYSQTVRCNPFYVPTSVTLFLDLYPSATIAYSLRKLKSDYMGNCIRVRRSSDNTEQDIGFVDNYLDTTSMKTFVGAVNNGFVVTWYDQSGNANNATQATAVSQPLIISTGVINRQNNIVCLNTTTNLHFIVSGATFNGGTFSFISALGAHVNQALGFFGNRNVTTGWNYGYSSTPNYQFFTFGAGQTNATINLAQQTKHLVFLTRVSTTSSLWINSTNSTSGTGSYNSSTSNFYIGRGGISTGTQGGANVGIYELIGYTTDQGSNRTGMETNVNNFYSLY